MTTRVALFRDPHEGAAVLKLPPWVRPASRTARYWHQPRSAALGADGRISVSFWCGPGRGNVSVDDFTDSPPEEARCGTCVGRRQGWERENGLIFTPRDHWALPRWCPGEGTATDWRHCFACGAKVNAAHYPSHGYAAHRPAPDLGERYAPCPRHGWRNMRTTWPITATLVCQTHGCTYQATPA